MSIKLWMTIAAMAAVTTGCSVKANLGGEPEPVPEPTPEPVAEPVPEPEPAPQMTKKKGHVTVTDDHLEIDQKIHFALNSDVIEADSNGLLEEISTVLKDHDEIAKVHVIGHTDSQGDPGSNKTLSEKRAASVVKALRGLGVKQEIDSRGAGESELVCKEETDECHEKNRRVEFAIEKK